MQLNITEMFPGTTRDKGRLSKEVIVCQVKRKLTELSRWPMWVRSIQVDPDQYSSDSPDKVPCRLERTQSCKTFKYEYGVLNHVNGEALGVLGKSKDRAEVRLLWEFLMLDVWSRLLDKYSGYLAPPISLSAPRPIRVVNEHELMMTFCSGINLDRLRLTDHSYQVGLPTGEEKVPLYLSVAFHLGALARIKENEELLHGDYLPRHLIFDFNGELPEVFRRVREAFVQEKPPHKPRLSVIDVENSTQAVAARVKEENVKLQEIIRKQTRGAFSLRHYDRYYEDGHNSIGPHQVLATVVSEQRTTLGVSIEHLF